MKNFHFLIVRFQNVECRFAGTTLEGDSGKYFLHLPTEFPLTYFDTDRQIDISKVVWNIPTDYGLAFWLIHFFLTTIHSDERFLVWSFGS